MRPIQPTGNPSRNLDQISTCWPALGDPVQFTLRYAPALERYLRSLIRNTHDAEEVLQDFLMRGLERGFFRAAVLRGRFRDYLKTAVRHAAMDYLRRRQTPTQGDFDLTELPDGEDVERGWLAEWQQCVLGRAWEALHAHQRSSPGNLFYSVLRLTADYPEESSAALADRVTQQTGQSVTADTFRKQVSRARRAFAALLVEEVKRTLQQPTFAAIEAELAELGLLPYVRDFLPAME